MTIIKANYSSYKPPSRIVSVNYLHITIRNTQMGWSHDAKLQRVVNGSCDITRLSWATFMVLSLVRTKRNFNFTLKTSFIIQELSFNSGREFFASKYKICNLDGQSTWYGTNCRNHNSYFAFMSQFRLTLQSARLMNRIKSISQQWHSGSKSIVTKWKYKWHACSRSFGNFSPALLYST